MSEIYTLEVANLIKKYSRQIALNNISFRIQRGEIVGFLGPNGAGKSTLMRILSTFQSATSGSVRVCGHDVFYDSHSARSAIGYLPEHNPLPLEMRVKEYLDFRARLRRLRNPNRLKSVIEQCEIGEVRHRILGQLSKGYRQRVGIADALMHEPDLIILDEPSAGLDPNQIRSMRTLIQSLAPQRTVLLSTHILSEVALTCARVIILHQGKILADEPTDKLLERYLRFANVVLEVEGSAMKIRQVLEACPWIDRVSQTSMDGNFTRFILRGNGQGDLRIDAFELARKHGWRLRELSHKEDSLETIFSHLTNPDAE